MVGLIEDVPQGILVTMIGERCEGGLGWELQLSLAIAFGSLAWKQVLRTVCRRSESAAAHAPALAFNRMLTPFLYHFGCME